MSLESGFFPNLPMVAGEIVQFQFVSNNHCSIDCELTLGCCLLPIENKDRSNMSA
jgi:hypothetical protein